MQGWVRGASAGAFVATALACAGALDAAQTEQVTGRWTCAFEAASDGPPTTVRFVGDASYLESGGLHLEGVIRATVETKDAPAVTLEWDAVLAGTWSVQSGKLCSTLTDSRFVPKGAPSPLARRWAEPGDFVPSGLASCDPIVELSEALMVTRKEADGTTVTCRRRP
jgi:hypothetical protein